MLGQLLRTEKRDEPGNLVDRNLLKHIGGFSKLNKYVQWLQAKTATLTIIE